MEMNGTYEEYLERLLAGDRRRCAEIVERLLEEDVEVRTLYEELFQRSLYEVGRRWQAGEVSVAAEHLATATTESLLTLVYPRLFAAEHVDRAFVVSCAANEYHQLGGKMAADVAELHGWHGYHLGANTPLEDLMDLIEDKSPDLLGLSLSVYFNLPALLEALDALRDRYAELPIIVGGQAFHAGGLEVLEERNVDYVGSLSELECRLRD